MSHIASKKVKFISFPTLQINQKIKDFRGLTLGNTRKKLNFRDSDPILLKNYYQ